MNRNIPKISLSLLLSVFFSGCGNTGDSASSDTGTSADLKGAGSAFYSLPSALQAKNPTVDISADGFTSNAKLLAKVSAGLDSGFATAMEPYRLVPAYIYVAESAKEQMKTLLDDIVAEDLPDNWEGVSDSGYRIRTVARDSSLSDEKNLRFRSLSMEKEGTAKLYASYFKNGRNQYSGSFLWHSEGPDSLWIAVHFNGRNSGVYGERLQVTVKRAASVLENDNAPTFVRVVSVRKNARVSASVISYHPVWHDEDSTGYSFWGAGPKIYAARAVADTAKNVALLKVAFADTAARAGTLFEDYLLDTVTKSRTTLALQRLMAGNDTLNRAVWWSLATGKSLYAPLSDSSSAADFLAYTAERQASDLTEEDAYQLMQNSNTDILSGSDRDLKKLYWAMTLEQPVLLRAGARIVGAGDVEESDDFGLVTGDLETDDVALPEPTDVWDTTDFVFPEE